MTTQTHQTFAIKRHDTLPTITISVTDEGGDPLDLTDATSVAFHMYTDASPRVAKVNETAAIVTPASDGMIEYGWDTADTDTSGEYLAEVVIVFSDGGVITFPTEGFVRVRVWDDLV